MRAVLPAIKRQGKGPILNASSTWGIVAVGGAIGYMATKAAVRHKNATISYGKDGIRADSAHPGIIDRQ
ncbi:hypothetical protein BZM26_24335 [Paraburkholderia strydomiana]|nr:hypothetical protein BZM26_24335 [Paraburkholderia strydomiana]